MGIPTSGILTDRVTPGPRLRFVIPKAVRTALGLKPGQKLDVWVEDGRIVMCPRPTPAEAYLADAEERQ